MTTVRDICDSALRRIRVVGAGQDVDPDDASVALERLNDMLHGWAAKGVNVAHQTFVLTDSFTPFCPPETATGETLAAVSFQATWNASTNSPSLASGVGTRGHLYKVSDAGSTVLDDVTSWAENDYALFDGSEWLKGKSFARHEGAMKDLLAFSLLDDFGKEPSQTLAKRAQDGWTSILADYVRVDEASFDQGLVMLPSRRFYGILQ